MKIVCRESMWVNVFQNYIKEQEGIEIEIGDSV